MDDIRTLIISASKTGHVNQCIGFCDLMGWPATDMVRIPAPGRQDPTFRKIHLNLLRRSTLRRATPRARMGSRLRLVASGVAAEPLCAAYRALYGQDLFAIFVGSPKAQTPMFDLAVASHHALERGQTASATLYSAAAVTVWMSGVLIRKVAAPAPAEENGPVVALIGGVNKAYAIDADAICKQLVAAVPPDTRLDVVFSRRTPDTVESFLRRRLAGPGVRFVGGSDRAGFEAAYIAARRFLVTPDSITMISEACASGKPTHLIRLMEVDRETSTARFVGNFEHLGYVLPLDQPAAAPIVPPAPDHVRDAVNALYDAWLARTSE